MRKLLLGTTAVVGAALLSTGAMAQGAPAPVAAAPGIAGANGLTVRLGGFFDFGAGLIQDDADRGTGLNGRPVATLGGRGAGTRARQRYDFRNDLELHVFINGTASNGMTYGAVFEFQNDNIAGSSAGTIDMDEAWMFVGMPGAGTVRFGQVDSAAGLLSVSPPGSQSLGHSGDWWRYSTDNGSYLLSGINDGNDATKIVYLSPQFAGFDFGASYAFNSGEGRRTDTQRDRTGIENEWSVGVRYRGTFGPVGLAASAAAMGANAPLLNANGTPIPGTSRGEDVRAYTVGAVVSGFGFALGGDVVWGSWNGSSVGRAAQPQGLDENVHFRVGATYTVSGLTVGAIWGQATQDNGRGVADRTQSVWGIGASYALAPGLTAYAYYNDVTDENVPVARAATGTVIRTFNGGTTRSINVLATGIRLAF